MNIDKTTRYGLGWGQTIFSLHTFYVIQILIRYMLKIKVKQQRMDFAIDNNNYDGFK